MATQIPTGNTEYDITNSNTTYVLAPNATRTTSNANGIFAGGSFHDDTIIVKGDIVQTGGSFAGIWNQSEDMRIEVVKGGLVSGDIGIYSEDFDGNKLVILNDGKIEGDGEAIHTDGNKVVVVNTGVIHGAVYLGSGADLFDNRGGVVDHKIQGGAGDDTLIVDKAGTKLQENGGSEGYDTVRSTVSYTLSANVERLVLLGNGNTNGTGNNDQSDLYGNKGNNKLFALDGSDILAGGRGNDKLFGGDDADTFQFRTGDGHDTIADFENGIDHIGLKNWAAITNFNDLKTHHLTVSGNDLVIHAGSDELVLLDTKKGQLDAGDFSF